MLEDVKYLGAMVMVRENQLLPHPYLNTFSFLSLFFTFSTASTCITGSWGSSSTACTGVGGRGRGRRGFAAQGNLQAGLPACESSFYSDCCSSYDVWNVMSF